jgi:hypothetical protein
MTVQDNTAVPLRGSNLLKPHGFSRSPSYWVIYRPSQQIEHDGMIDEMLYGRDACQQKQATLPDI